MPDIRFIVNAVNKTKGPFEETERQLKELREETKLQEKQFEELRKQGQLVGMALLGVSAAGGALILRSTQLSARVQTLGVILERAGVQAGYSQRELEQYEAGVMALGITTQAARQSLLQMIQAQMDLDDASRLARVAQNAAVVANINSSEAFMRLVTAIQRGETEMLRTMGIVVNFGDAYKQAAEASDRTTTSLTEQEKMQIRVNTVVQSAAPISDAYSSAMETAGKQTLSMDRLLEEMSLTLGDEVLPAYTGVVTGVYDALKSFAALDPVTKSTAANLVVYGTGITGVAGGLTMVISKLPALQAGFQALGITLSAGSGGILAVLGALAALVTALLAHKNAVNSNTSEMQNWFETQGYVIDGVDRLLVANMDFKNALRDSKGELISMTDATKLNLQALMDAGYTFKIVGNTLKIYDKDMHLVTGSIKEEADAVEAATLAELEHIRQLENFETQAKITAAEIVAMGDAAADLGPRLEEGAGQVAGSIEVIEQQTDALEANREAYEALGIDVDDLRERFDRNRTSYYQTTAASNHLTEAHQRAAIGMEVTQEEVDKQIDQLIKYLQWLLTNGPTIQYWLGVISAGAASRPDWVVEQQIQMLQGGDVVGAGKFGEVAEDFEGLVGQSVGGPLEQAAMVGEEGEEMIINGIVIPHDLTKKLVRLGLKPRKGFAVGGPVLDPGIGGGGDIDWDYPDPDTDTGWLDPNVPYVPSPSTGGGGTTSEPAPTGTGGAPPAPTAPVEAPPSITEVVEASAQGAGAVFGAQISTQIRLQEQQQKEMMKGMREMVQEIRLMAEEIPRAIRDELRGELG